LKKFDWVLGKNLPKTVEKGIRVNKYTLLAYLHEGPNQSKAIELLGMQMENASQRESNLLWDSIQKLRKTETQLSPMPRQRRIYRK